nr:PadR family transcriptional regulator [Candidatus Krumholzibacteriota bacterium]
ENAYGVTICEQIVADTGQEWTLGAVYSPLHRLEKKELVATVKGEPLPERGGRSRIYYRVTREGKKALLEIKQINAAIWLGIPSLELERS